VDQKHEIVRELKRVAYSLGRTPTRDEFNKESAISKHEVVRVFGTYTELLKASGLDKKTQKESAKKRIKEFFEKDIEEFTQPEKKAILPPNEVFPRIAIIGDTHFPWICHDSLSLVYTYLEQLKPQYVIQIGDLYDLYGHSRWPKSQLQFTPSQEVKIAREMASQMWKQIQTTVPNAKCIQLLGNHCIRPHRAVIAAGLGELEEFFNFNALFNFENVETIYDPREPYILGGITFIHGHLTGLGAHIPHFGGHVVHGHSHKGGLIYKRVLGKNFFELDVGYLGKADAKCFTFTASKITNWTRGLGFIHELGPIWIPFD
jgi:hypothetical protein